MGRQDFRTPQWLFRGLEEHFMCRFTLDAAASEGNALCSRYYTELTDGLRSPWERRTFCNPPFRDSGKWVLKAVEEAQRGNATCMILPVVCSQSWFHQALPFVRIHYPNKRISFDLPDGTPTKGADRDSVILWVSNYSSSGQVSTLDVRSMKARWEARRAA